MLGLWKDSAGDIYGFYKDNSFFGQWKDEEQDVLGVYALSSDGEYTALVMQFANDDGTYDDENMVTYLVQANEEENLLELYDEENLELTATLEPYQADGDEADYNQTYQDMGDILTECYSGETEAGETFIYAANDDGTFCSVLVIDQDDNYVSFVGEVKNFDMQVFLAFQRVVHNGDGQNFYKRGGQHGIKEETGNRYEGHFTKRDGNPGLCDWIDPGDL